MLSELFSWQILLGLIFIVCLVWIATLQENKIFGAFFLLISLYVKVLYNIIITISFEDPYEQYLEQQKHDALKACEINPECMKKIMSK